MSLESIQRAIPHRDPFLLLDEIVEQDEMRIVCRKTFTGDEWWYAGHYPGAPITPGVLLCESAMQAGAVLLSARILPTSGKVPVATRANHVQFKRIVRPGETILIEVELTDQLSGAYFLTGRISVEGKLAARLEFACTMAELRDNRSERANA
jgi:3-hydroxyacyl-[acyl-carrier-protein] dehydratase